MKTGNNGEHRWVTFQTAKCPRLMADIPYVGCCCVDCVAIMTVRRNAYRAYLGNEWKPSKQDKRFLKSLRISAE